MPIIERQQTVYLAKCDECGREMEPTVHESEAPRQAKEDNWYVNVEHNIAFCEECK